MCNKGLPLWLGGRVRLPMQEMWVGSLIWEGPVEKEMETHYLPETLA